MLRAILIAAMLAATLAASGANAQSPAPRDGAKEAEEMAREALDKLMRAMSALIASIPQYEMPETLPNGDIIIRRKRPAETKPPPKEDRT
jgi:hypothetical protein